MQDFRVIGNICNDLALEQTQSGKTLLKFGVAVKRDYVRGDNERQADFFDCLAWGGTAENIARWCKKGDKIYLQGRIEIRSYEDNQGIKRKAIDFIIDKTEFLGVKKESGDEFETQERTTKPNRPTLQDMSDDSEIPFN